MTPNLWALESITTNKASGGDGIPVELFQILHGTPPASRDVPGERGRLSSCIWNLAFFSERGTEKLPLRVDFIHRVEFGEVSGHRVLIKRGLENRGTTECGATHEATSGMSS